MLFDRLIFVMDTHEVILKVMTIDLCYEYPSQEFIVIPKCFYTQQNNSTLQVLKDPEVEQKAKSLTLLKRNKTFTETSPVDENEKIANENLLRSRYPDSGPETKKTTDISSKIEASAVIDFIEIGESTVDTNSTKISLSTYLYNLQQPTKNLKDPAYSIVSEELQLKPDLIPSKNTKKILNRSLETTRKRKDHSPNFWHASDEESEENYKGKVSGSKTWTTLKRTNNYGRNYTQGPAAYGSIQNLMKASKLSK